MNSETSAAESRATAVTEPAQCHAGAVDHRRRVGRGGRARRAAPRSPTALARPPARPAAEAAAGSSPARTASASSDPAAACTAESDASSRPWRGRDAVAHHREAPPARPTRGWPRAPSRPRCERAAARGRSPRPPAPRWDSSRSRPDGSLASAELAVALRADPGRRTAVSPRRADTQAHRRMAGADRRGCELRAPHTSQKRSSGPIGSATGGARAGHVGVLRPNAVRHVHEFNPAA